MSLANFIKKLLKQSKYVTRGSRQAITPFTRFFSKSHFFPQFFILFQRLPFIKEFRTVRYYNTRDSTI